MLLYPCTFEIWRTHEVCRPRYQRSTLASLYLVYEKKTFLAVLVNFRLHRYRRSIYFVFWRPDYTVRLRHQNLIVLRNREFQNSLVACRFETRSLLIFLSPDESMFTRQSINRVKRFVLRGDERLQNQRHRCL